VAGKSIRIGFTDKKSADALGSRLSGGLRLGKSEQKHVSPTEAISADYRGFCKKSVQRRHSRSERIQREARNEARAGSSLAKGAEISICRQNPTKIR